MLFAVAVTIAVATPPSALAAPDTVGLVDPATGVWYLRNGAGNTYSFFYGNPGDLPFAGDWDCDGVDTPGLYRQSDGFVYLRNSNSPGIADVSFFFGDPGDIPIAGDFDGDGCDTVSVYRPSQGRVFVINELGDGDQGLGAADTSYFFGNPGDAPFTGDFNGDGIATVGLYRESTGLVYFRNSHTQGIAEFQFFFGNPGDRFVGGDWTDGGFDAPGLFRPSQAAFYLKHENTQGNADEQFGYGTGTMRPVAGHWSDIPATPDIALQPAATGLTQPLFATSPPGDDRLFIVERGGAIKILDGGAVRSTPFLTVTGLTTSGAEQGLLGLAFHPNYPSNGRFFVNYTDNTGGDTVIAEYHADPAANIADLDPVRVIATIDQPASNHNGGMLAFGPDGYLYAGMGDGGGTAARGNAQDPTDPLGDVLRLDVDGAAPYAAPGNPYNGTNGDLRVWATGLRNPWRFSFDRLTGDLYIGDVGEGAWEEIDVVTSDPGGLNYGWPVMEGNHCFGGGSCNTAGLTLPLIEYPHPDGISVTGGYVYRGTAMPALHGTYFYGDLSGFIRSFRLVGNTATDPRDWTGVVGSVGALASFGEDGAGELYVVSLNGTVYKIVPAG
jgi:glucose/arabinose dehydrogenase